MNSMTLDVNHIFVMFTEEVAWDVRRFRSISITGSVEREEGVLLVSVCAAFCLQRGYAEFSYR